MNRNCGSRSNNLACAQRTSNRAWGVTSARFHRPSAQRRYSPIRVAGFHQSGGDQQAARDDATGPKYQQRTSTPVGQSRALTSVVAEYRQAVSARHRHRLRTVVCRTLVDGCDGNRTGAEPRHRCGARHQHAGLMRNTRRRVDRHCRQSPHSFGIRTARKPSHTPIARPAWLW